MGRWGRGRCQASPSVLYINAYWSVGQGDPATIGRSPDDQIATTPGHLPSTWANTPGEPTEGLRCACGRNPPHQVVAGEVEVEALDRQQGPSDVAPEVSEATAAELDGLISALVHYLGVNDLSGALRYVLTQAVRLSGSAKNAVWTDKIGMVSDCVTVRLTGTGGDADG